MVNLICEFVVLCNNLERGMGNTFVVRTIMKVAVLSASPKQKNSLTLQTVRVLSRMCKEDEFDVCFITNVDDKSEFEAKAKEADLLIILSSLYHFNTHGQLMRYLKGINLPKGKPITYISTSGMNMDVPAHNYLRSFARHYGLKWIRSLSLLDEDVLQECRREELYRWFLYVKDIASKKELTSSSLNGTRIAVLDCGDDPSETETTAIEIKNKYEALGANVKLINMREKNIKGCIACFGCYTNNKCVIKDDFMELSHEIDTTADMVVVVSGINYNQFSTNYKYYLDRHVMYGRYSQELEQTKAYVYCGDIDGQDLAELEQHTYVVDSLCDDCYVGLYPGTSEGIQELITESSFCCINDLFPQRNTYSSGLGMQFANLAYRLQYMTPNDYNYFKSKGYYEMPKIIEEVKPIGGIEDGQMSCKMRLLAFNEMLKSVDGPPKLTHRGERSKMNHMIGADMAKVNGKAKKGFSLFGKK